MRLKRLATTSFIVLGLLAAVSALTQFLASTREARAEAAYPPEGEFVTIDGRRVHYVTKGTGPDLIMLHGANGSAREFTFAFMDRMATAYRVTVFDRPGMGYSDRTDPAYSSAFASEAESPAEQAALLNAAARAIGITRPIVMGHSFGGAVAMAWALDHDPAAVVMVAGVANPWPGELGWYYTVNGTSLGGAFVVPVITAFASQSRIQNAVDSVFAPQEPPEGYDDHIGPVMAIRRPSFRANTRQVNTLYPHIVEMSERYPTLTLPIEIVHGSADSTVPLSVHSEPLSQQVKGANLTVLDGIGHMPHHAAADEVEAAIHRAAARAGLR